MKKEISSTSATSFLCLVFLAIVFIASSCQPKTVMVERRDGELVPVTPPPQPEFVVIERGPIRIGNFGHTVYKIVDLEERQICTAIVRHGATSSLSCRPMTLGEIIEWK